MRTTLYQITTRDKITLEGLLFEPERRGRSALVFIHGITGNFYGNPTRLNTLAQILARNGVALAAFNTRGHDIISTAKKLDKRKKKGYTYKTIGAAFEDFTKSVFDIDAVVRFLKKKGYGKIFLAGHSTGANKTTYYMYKTHGAGVFGAALLSPISDVPGAKDEGGREFKKLLELAQKMVKRSRGDKLMPTEKFEWPKTAQRFLSLATPGSREDVFQYHLKKPKFREFSSIRKPLLVLLGEKDQYAPPYKIAEIADSFKRYVRSRHFRLVVLRGSDHSFIGKEKQLAKALVKWVKAVSS